MHNEDRLEHVEKGCVSKLEVMDNLDETLDILVYLFTKKKRENEETKIYSLSSRGRNEH